MLHWKIQDSGREKTRLFLSIGAFCVTIFSMVCLFVFGSSISRAATAPAIITYQGKLLVNSLAASTTQSMYFVLYDSATGGNALYTAGGTISATTSISVTPSNGIFTVNLGGSGTNSLDENIFKNNANVYLEVRVANEILSPRKQITASPYAFNSRFLDGVAATSTASSSTYIPISDSTGNFAFNNVTTTNVTSTKFYSTAASVFAGGLISNASSSFSSLHVSGNLNASSTLFLGGNVMPGANNSTNLGAFGSALGSIYSSSTAYLQNVTISGTCTGCGGGGGAGGNGFFSATSSFIRPLTVTDGTTTSSLYANAFAIATSTANNLGLFYVDSSGNISASGTSQTFGLSTLLSGFIANASSSIGAGLQVAGALNASSSFQVAGNTNLGDSDAAGGDTTRIFGALALGVSPTGDAMFSMKATSTAAMTLQKWIDNNGGVIASLASSTAITPNGATGQSTLNGTESVLTIGDSSGKSGFINLQGGNVTGNTTDYTGLALRSWQGGLRAGIFWTGLESQLYLGSSGATTTLTNNAFTFGQTASQASGVFNVDSSGNVSASGTFKVFGGTTMAALTTFPSGFISQASSSVSAGLQVAGALNASGTVNVANLSTNGGIVFATSSGQLTVSSSLFWNNINGRVGIGTTAPSKTLQVHSPVLGGGMYLSSNSPGIEFGNDAVLGSATNYGSLGLATAAASWGSSAVAGDLVLSSGSTNLIIATGATPSSAGTSRITINHTTGLVTMSNALTAGGNIYTSSRIGAGNTNPSVLLHVGTGASSQGYIRLENSGSANKEANIYNDTTNGGLHIDTNSNLYPIQLDGSYVRSTDGFISNASTSIGSTLSVLGATTVSSTFLATGLATLRGGFISNASSSIGAGLQVTGALNASGTLFTNNIIPASNNTKDIGAFDTAYRTLYVSTSVLVGNPSAGGGTPVDVQSTFNGDTILNVKNGSNGGSAAARFQVQNDTSNGSLSMFGSGYNLASGFANRFAFLTGTAAAGIDMIAQATTGDLRFMAGGLTTGLYMGANRNIAIGSFSPSITPVAPDKLTVYGNIKAGSGTVTSTLGSNFLAIATSTANNNGIFYVDSSGNTSASGTLAVFGNSTLGDSDAAGGDSTRVYGSLNIGGDIGGGAQLYIKVTSTVAYPLVIDDVNGAALFQAASSTGMGLMDATTEVTVNGMLAVMTLGNANGLTGFIDLKQGARGQAAGIAPGIIIRDRTSGRVGAQLSAGSIILGQGTASTTLNTNTFIMAQQSGKNAGVFYVNTSGDVAASGTLQIAGASTLTGLTTMTGGFISGASSSVTTLNVNTINLTGTGSITGTSSFTGYVGIGTSTPSAPLFVGGRTPTPLASAGTSPQPKSIAVQGRYAYVVGTNSNTSLGILDIYDIATNTPALMSSTTNSNIKTPTRVVVQGRYAYVGNGGGSPGFAVFDINNPASPSFVVSYSLPGGVGAPATDMVIQGKYLYVLDGTNSTLFAFDISNLNSIQQVGSISTAASQQALTVSGNYVYVVGSTLQIFNIGDPSNIAQVGGNSGAQGTTAAGIAIQESMAFISETSANELRAVNISNPSSPELLSSASVVVAGFGNPKDVVAQGRYVYLVTQSSSQVEVFDVSSPGAVTRLGTVFGGATTIGLAVNGRYVYAIGNGDNTLNVIDAGGAYIQQLEVGGVEGGYLALRNNLSAIGGSFAGGLSVGQSLNVSGDLGVYGTSTFKAQVSVSGLIKALGGFISNASSSIGAGLQVAGALNASSSFQVAGNSMLGDSDADGGDSTRIFGSLAMGASPTGNAQLYIKATSTVSYPLRIEDSNGALIMSAVSSTAVGLINPSTEGVGQDYAVLTLGSTSGLSGFIDLKQSAAGVAHNMNPGIVIRNNTSGGIGAFLSGGSLTLSNGTASSTLYNQEFIFMQQTGKNQGLFHIDNSGNISASGTMQQYSLSTFLGGFISNASSSVGANFQVAGTLIASSTVLVSGSSSLAVDIGRVGIGTTTPNEKLHLTNGTLLIDTPSSPTLKGSSTSTNAMSGIYISGKYAYVGVSAATDAFQIFDISDPKNPSIVGSVAAPSTYSYAQKIFVSGKYAYVPNFNQNLQIFNVSNPAAPAAVATYSDTSNGTAPYVVGRYVYYTNNGGGNLNVLDITNPYSPTLVSAYVTSTATKGLYISGQYAYVVLSNSLVTFDISTSTPAEMSEFFGLTNISAAKSVYVSGNFAYVADNSGGLRIINVSDRRNPVQSSNLSFTGATNIYVSGKYAYIADGTNLRIVDVSSSTAPALVGTFAAGSTVNDVQVVGKYAYLATSNGLKVVDVKGADINSASIGAIATNDLTITENGEVGNSLYVRNNLNVGIGGISSNGEISISAMGAAAGGGLVIAATAATTTFTSAVSNAAGSGAFVFDTKNSIASTTAGTNLDRVLFAVANAGTNKFAISGGGNVYATAGFNAKSTQYGIGDVAEYVDLEFGTTADSGDILIVSTSSNHYRKSTGSYSTAVAGVISDTGAFVIGADGAGRVPLGLAGVVHTNVSAENGAISVGDYLVTAAMPGHAMRYDPASGKAGSIIGVALESLSSGTGKINVLLQKQLVSDFVAGLTSALTVDTANGMLKVGSDQSPYTIELSGNLNMTGTSLNKLSFATTTLFASSVGAMPGARAFIFDAANFAVTSTDAYVLSVRSGNQPVFSVMANGDVRAKGDLYAASAIFGTSTNPGDLAERVDIALDDIAEAGDVMMVDPASPDRYRRSNEAYSQSVAGVISTNPSIIVGNGKTKYTAVLAMTGRVPVKVVGDNGPIKRGDLLVAASSTGFAMKYDPGRDSSAKMVAVIGMALDDFSASSTGKIMALIRTGWIYNRDQTIFTLKQDVQTIAGATGVVLSSAASTTSLTVQTAQGGNILASSGGTDINMYGASILNVASVVGKNKLWEIDRNGYFISHLTTSAGDKSMYGLESPTAEFVFSSSSQLMAGEVRVDFDAATQEIIDKTQPLKVTVTLTSGEARGIYVSQKDATGFTVKELSGGISNATFDWIVVAKRIDPLTSGITNVAGIKIEGATTTTSSTANTASAPVPAPAPAPTPTPTDTTTAPAPTPAPAPTDTTIAPAAAPTDTATAPTPNTTSVPPPALTTDPALASNTASAPVPAPAPAPTPTPTDTTTAPAPTPAPAPTDTTIAPAAAPAPADPAAVPTP